MRIQPTRTRFFAVLAMLVLASAACNLPFSSDLTQSAPAQAPAPTVASAQIVQQPQDTPETPGSGAEVSITVSEDELNAFIQQEMASQTDLPFRNPHVHLASGKAIITGNVTLAGLDANASAVLLPSVAAGGQPKLTVQSISIGSIPVPDALVSQVNQQVENTLSDYLAAQNTSFKVTAITVTEGKITITGTNLQ